MKGKARAAIFLLLALTLRAQEPSTATPGKSIALHVRATVEAVVPLANFSGEVIQVDHCPAFALTLRVESVEPSVAEFASSFVTLAIHSPSLLFAGPPTKGGTYNFYLRRATKDVKPRFFDLRVGTKLLTTDLTADTGHGRCAENDDPVGYPLKGWVGYTNTGQSVQFMTLQAFIGRPGFSTQRAESSSVAN